MPRTPERPAALVNSWFRADQVIARGLLTRKQLRSRAWRRIFPGIYADAALPDTHRLRCVAAIRNLLPPGSVIAGRSAATLLGPGLSAPDDPVEALVPVARRRGPVRGLRLRVADLSPDEVCQIGGLPVTTPLRTCWDLARWLDPVDAVVLVDRLLATARVSPRELRELAQRRSGDQGWLRFGRVVRLADGRAESPQESRLRVRLAQAGLPPPQVQYEVFGTDGFVARVDLAWPQLKIAVEYDGLGHVASARQMGEDRRRLNRLVSEGWIVLHITASRMRDDFAGFLAELRAIIRAHRALRVGRDRAHPEVGRVGAKYAIEPLSQPCG